MKSNARPVEAVRIAVFAKAPVAGDVKTRLTALLGRDGAAGLHAGLVRHALSTAVGSGLGPVELWCAPDENHEFFVRCARETSVVLRRQEGRDLGERMGRAFDNAIADGQRLLLIGSDCPALTAKHLAAAAQALQTYDAVFTPAEDGGYVLIGMSRALGGVFDGIEWGAASVMGATRERLRAVKARWLEMPALWDVDRPDDYARLQREGLLQEVLS